MLFYEHLEIMEATKDRAMNLALQAGWANRSWCQVVSSTLALLVDEGVLSEIDIRSTAPGDEGAQQRTETFARMVIGTGAWSMAVYELPGKAFAGLLDEDLHAARSALEQCQSDCEAVQKALQLREDPQCNDCEDLGGGGG